MSNPYPTEPELLKAILEPLLEDFQYWFSRACNLLESERISFLEPDTQAELLKRVKHNQQQARRGVGCGVWGVGYRVFCS